MIKITRITRKGILLDLLNFNIDLEDILSEFFTFSSLPSTDSRYEDMHGDYYQHRKNNLDWEDDWFLKDERIKLYEITDKEFLRLLCFIVHSENINTALIINIVNDVNQKLMRDGFELKPSSEKISGMRIYIGSEILGGNKSLNFYTTIDELYENLNLAQGIEEFPVFTGNRSYPCIVLEYSSWDDYSRRTSFICDFYENEENSISLGQIKILDKDISTQEQENYGHTIIAPEFKQLNSDYCSLFTSRETYKILDTKSLRQYKKTILEGLNDITYNHSILNTFKNLPGFSTSLLRGPEAFSIVDGIKINSLDFGIQNFNGNINFSFNKNTIKDIPHRIKVLIGKNGCGKTTLLSNISQEIVDYNEEKSKLSKRPGFSKIIQISYSIFDTFQKPKEGDMYIYCGLKDNHNNTPVDIFLKNKLSESLTIIESKSKESVYLYLLKDLLDTDTLEFNALLDTDTLEFNALLSVYDSYSSGQKILITILAQIISHIDNNSLLLFDEPETHLHPNMIFKLIKVLYDLLEDNESHLIIATHSPIVLQQVPSNNVYVLNEFGNNKLNLECFGENFSSITKEIFSNYEEDDILYKEIFNTLLKNKYTENSIIEHFEGKLSLNARIYLKAIFNKD